MKTEIVNKLCRIRLEKLAPEDKHVTHRIVYKRRKGGKQLQSPMAGGEARRAHKEGKWCYWVTVTCPTDKIKRGDLVLDTVSQTVTRIQLDVTEEFLNIISNDDNMEKVIASRNDQHLRLAISDQDVDRFLMGTISDRVQVKYEVRSWEETCPTCKGVGRYPKYPQFKCKCGDGQVTIKIVSPLPDGENNVIMEEHQTVFTRQELIEKLHQSLDASATSYGPLRKVFVKQLDNWIDKHL